MDLEKLKQQYITKLQEIAENQTMWTGQEQYIIIPRKIGNGTVFALYFTGKNEALDAAKKIYGGFDVMIISAIGSNTFIYEITGDEFL